MLNGIFLLMGIICIFSHFILLLQILLVIASRLVGSLSKHLIPYGFILLLIVYKIFDVNHLFFTLIPLIDRDFDFSAFKMDPKGSLCAKNCTRTSSLTSPGNGLQTNLSSDPPSFYGVRIESPFKEFIQPSPPTQSVLPGESNADIDIPDQENCPLSNSSHTSKLQDWNPSAMLNNLSFLEEKIHQLQDQIGRAHV